ncbi:hypothetical protein TNCV_1588671 [Trichonephila clavipes]|uniref:Uncharacterized protein n=1 Tax=Trichonephila clavipes TaxID=2585209 RepID=A0A8X6RNM7_TRICX|nr:hypothetical protein TNCV_1588671 [Trichonephila clavipes]
MSTSDAEILEGFSDQGVVQVRRITLKKDAALIPTKHIILTFNSPKLPTTIKAGYLNSQADHLTSTSPIAAISESESVNPIPNNVPSTSNISAFPSNSGIQPTSASTSIQDAKLKAKTRARKRKKELLKKINDAIIEIKMAPHKPRKSTPEQDSEDEDMIEYNPDEFDPDDYVQNYYNIGDY